MPWLLPLVAGVAVLGLSLVALGLRGRRVGDHPLCRQCGFDLRGTPAATVCNECGADLTRPKAIQIGHLQRRRRQLAWGLALLVPCLLVGGLLVFPAVRDYDWRAKWRSLEPAGWLLSDLRSADAATADPAFAELRRRMFDETLDPASIAAFLDRGLELQGDPTFDWTSPTGRNWGELLVGARRRGQIDDGRWATFAWQAVGLTMSVRPDVRQGDSLPIRLNIADRNAAGASFQAFVEVTRLSVGEFVDDRPRGSGGVLLWQSHPHSIDLDLRLDGFDTDGLPVGPAPVEVRVEVTVGEATDVSPANYNFAKPTNNKFPSLLRRQATFAGRTNVRGRDEPARWLSDSPAAEAEARANLAVSDLVPLSSGSTYAYGLEAPLILVVRTNTPDRTPADYDVTLEVGGGEVSMQGPLLWTTGRGYESREFAVESSRLGSAQAVTVVLRPRADAAAGRVDGLRPWAGELRFEAVPISSQPLDRAFGDPKADHPPAGRGGA